MELNVFKSFGHTRVAVYRMFILFFLSAHVFEKENNFVKLGSTLNECITSLNSVHKLQVLIQIYCMSTTLCTCACSTDS